MKIVDRYMAWSFLASFTWCLVTFLVMAIIIDIFSFIDNIVRYKIPGISILAFYVYYSPTILIQVTPMAALLSTIYVLSNLNKNSEITAMKACGISLWRILRPILVIGFIISVATYIVNDKVIPTSSRISEYIRINELEKEKRKSTPTKTIKNVAVYGAGNRIIFARSYDTEKKMLEDIIIHKHDAHENLISKITAQSGTWNGNEWVFKKVIAYRINNAGEFRGEPQFSEERVIPIKEKPSDFANKEWKSDFLSYRDLRRYIKNFAGIGTRFLRGLLVDLHYKVAFPFISLIIIVIGAPFALITTRGGVLIGIGMSIAIGLLYYASIAIALAFGKAGVIPPVLAAWFGNIVFGILGIYLMNKRA